jgi:hypothetical protein
MMLLAKKWFVGNAHPTLLTVLRQSHRCCGLTDCDCRRFEVMVIIAHPTFYTLPLQSFNQFQSGLLSHFLIKS